jgi:hypothetical protein
MPALDRSGAIIHCEVHGNGPAVLLSHGFSATCRVCDGQIAAFNRAMVTFLSGLAR